MEAPKGAFCWHKAINTYMKLSELHSFKMSDAISLHDKLNPKLWNGQVLRSEVKSQLLIIAEDFLSELGVKNLDVVDITVSGSNAAFSYTKHSDLDLHLIVDLSSKDDDEIYKELFNARKTLYNDSHAITIHGIPVELYVQDSRDPVVSLGEYSVLRDEWIRTPTKRRANLDQTACQHKYERLTSLIQRALRSKDYDRVSETLQKIRQYRQAGLDKHGEFGPENLVFKAVRSKGLVTKLYALRDKLHSENLTIENMYEAEPEITVESVAYQHGLDKFQVLDRLIIEMAKGSDESTALAQINESLSGTTSSGSVASTDSGFATTMVQRRVPKFSVRNCKTKREFIELAESTWGVSPDDLLSESFIDDGQRVLEFVDSIDEFSALNIRVGTDVAAWTVQLVGSGAEIWGFLIPRTITDIEYNDNGEIVLLRFSDDEDDCFPRAEHMSYNGTPIVHSAVFGSYSTASINLSATLMMFDEMKVVNHVTG